MEKQLSDRNWRFFIGLALALSGYTTMMFTAASGINSVTVVWMTQIAEILFIIGVAVMLLTA